MEKSVEIKRLSELKASNPYLRLGTDVTDLEKSIRTLGLIAPLVISKDNVILAGARRYQALLNLGYVEAPVKIIDRSPLERELVSIDENLVRKDLSKLEVESQLRRAKEIYQELRPVIHDIEQEEPAAEQAQKKSVKKTELPASEFLHMVSEKTGLSPKQIHEAINRDEHASPIVKEARLKGELSLSQTNEIVKLNKDDQLACIEHVKELPVRKIREFVKLAKTQGVQKAMTATPKMPHQKDFAHIEASMKKILKKLKQLELEGFEPQDFPQGVQDLLAQLTSFGADQSVAYQQKAQDRSLAPSRH